MKAKYQQLGKKVKKLRQMEHDSYWYDRIGITCPRYIEAKHLSIARAENGLPAQDVHYQTLMY